MKYKLYKLPFLLIFFAQYTILTAQINPSYKIGTWQGFASAAVSYTWDDNTPKQLTVAKPLFDNYNLKATFFIVTGWGPNWSGFQAASNNGHEIGSHTKTHPSFSTLDEAQRTDELLGSKTLINTNISGASCVTVAYPNCVTAIDSQIKAHYISARICSGQIEPPTPANMMRVSSIICGTTGSIQTTDNFNTKVNSAIPNKGWVVFLLHGIDGDGGYSPIVSTELDAHLSFMNQHRNDFWVATYGNVVKYIRERNESTLVEVSNVNDSIVFTLNHSLGSIYNTPLSIERVVPVAWQSAVVMQGNNRLISAILDVNGVKSIRFNALPNGENIVIKGSKSVGTAELESVLNKLKLYPNPSSTFMNLDYSLQKAGHVSIDITNQSGQIIEQIINQKYAIGDYHFAINTARLSKQVYYVVIVVDGVKQVTKMLIF
jgi:Polysaccharide deacetylase/Secretion system C-terminal sorting domain